MTKMLFKPPQKNETCDGLTGRKQDRWTKKEKRFKWFQAAKMVQLNQEETEI